MTEEILKRVDALAAKMSDIAAQYGPEAFETVAAVLQAKAVAGIITPPILFALFVWAAIAAFRKAKNLRNSAPHEDMITGMFVLGISTSAGAVFMVGVVVFQTLNPVYWLAALDGKFAIAAHLLKAI